MSFLQRRILRLRIRSWLLILLLLPLLAWGGLNLLLSTSLGTDFLAKKIQKRIGFPCRMESVTWSPWAGVTVSDFQLLAPESESVLATIRQIQVDPSWRSLMKGKKRWEKLEVIDFEAEVSIEMLREILARAHNPEKGEVEEPPAGEAVLAEALPEKGDQDPRGENSEALKGKPAPEKAPTPEAPVITPSDDFEGVIVFKNARCRVYSERIPELSLSLGGVDGEIPIWGETREGHLSLENLEIAGRFSESGLNFPLQWKGGTVSVIDHEFELFGLEMILSGAVRLGAGLPYGIQIELPDQQMDLSPIVGLKSSPLEIEKLRSKNRLRGYLLSPGSFRGTSVTSFRNLVVNEPGGGGTATFDRGSARLVATAAGLVAKDLRMIGDDDAVLMNGFLTTGGQAAATVRLVSSPQRAESHRQRVRKSFGNMVLEFQPLVTPDREYRDIRIEAREGGLMMDLGEKQSWVPFLPAVKAVLGRGPQERPSLP